MVTWIMTLLGMSVMTAFLMWFFTFQYYKAFEREQKELEQGLSEHKFVRKIKFKSSQVSYLGKM